MKEQVNGKKICHMQIMKDGRLRKEPPPPNCQPKEILNSGEPKKGCRRQNWRLPDP
jgi:hypothetical protein